MSSPLSPLSLQLSPLLFQTICPTPPRYSNQAADPNPRSLDPQAGSPIEDLVIVSLPGSPEPTLPQKSMTASIISLRENPSQGNPLNEAELKACEMASELFKNLFESDLRVPQKDIERFTKKFSGTVKLGDILTTAKLSPDIYDRCLELLQLYQTHRDQGRASLANSILNLVIENAKKIQNSYMQCTLLLKINRIQQSLTDSLPSTHPDKEALKVELASIAQELENTLTSKKELENTPTAKKELASPYSKFLRLIQRSKEREQLGDVEQSENLLKIAFKVALEQIPDVTQQYEAFLQIIEVYIEKKNLSRAELVVKFICEKVELIGNEQLKTSELEKVTQLLKKIKTAEIEAKK